VNDKTGSDGVDSTTEHELTAVEPSHIAKTSTADMLNTALVQLKELGNMRREEMARQARLIAEVQQAAKRNTIIGRLILLVLLLVLVLGGGTAFFIYQMEQSQEQAGRDLQQVGDRLERTSAAIDASADRQLNKLGLVQEEIIAARTAQQGASDKLKKSMSSTAASIRKQSKALKAVQTEMANSISSIREERDAVRKNVEQVLNSKTDALVARETDLRTEEMRFRSEEKAALAKRSKVIKEAIRTLSALDPEVLAGETPASDQKQESDDGSSVESGLSGEDEADDKSHD